MTKVVLAISETPYMLDEGVGFDQLPDAVRAWADDGSVDVLTTENIGPYRKLLPALRKYGGEDAIIVTADDDIAYPQGWLRVLVDAVTRCECVAAFRARTLATVADGFASYGTGKIIADEGEVGPAHNILPTGRDGVAYHSQFFPDPDILDELRELAPLQDDLGHKIACMIAGVPALRADRGQTSHPHGEYFPNVNRKGEQVALWQRNTKGENDQALGRIYDWLSERHPAVLDLLGFPS
ncbi:MAG: hypothetical protein ACU0FO_09215 [Pseudooceanicola nanhaiensis]|uniref:hypothetical protein n=1 Tax=Pseudooceanicola nanhaiensis TaxID=375761 RepID=UPI00405A358B